MPTEEARRHRLEEAQRAIEITESMIQRTIDHLEKLRASLAEWQSIAKGLEEGRPPQL
jgi:hypothetical protein